MSDEPSVADGAEHSLDPRVIPLQQITGALLTAAVTAAALVGLGFNLLADDDLGRWGVALRLVAWLIVVLLLAWHSYRWPPIAYRRTSYRVDDQGIEIRRGVYWRVVINIPRSRVQHIDVSQGPIERRYALGTLVIYTAGTDHAKLELEGLEHGRALAIREHLLPSGAGDAV